MAHTLRWTRQDLEKNFPGAATLGQVIQAIEADAQSRNSVVCSIQVNGMRISENDETKFQTCKTQEISEMEVTVERVACLLRDTIESTLAYLKKVQGVTYQTADQMRGDDLSLANKNFDSLLGGLNWLLETFSEIRAAAIGDTEASHRAALRQQLGKSWEGCQRQFLSHMAALVTAFEKRDFILVADILEYDLTASLNEWERQLGAIAALHGEYQGGQAKAENLMARGL